MKNFILLIPAILEQDTSEFRRMLKRYKESVVLHIDILNNYKNFPDSLKIENVLNCDNLYGFQKLYFHLMTDKADIVLSTLTVINNYAAVNKKIAFSFLIDEEYICLCDKVEMSNNFNLIPVIYSRPNKNKEFYANYEEILVMTVEAGKQGSKFNKKKLNNISILEKLGYKGNIMVDGGINDKTLSHIVNYKISSAVIGSYFKSSENFALTYKNLLNVMLNSKIS